MFKIKNNIEFAVELKKSVRPNLNTQGFMLGWRGIYKSVV